MIDDVFAFTLGVWDSPALMSGDVQGVNDELDQFLTLNLSKVNHFRTCAIVDMGRGHNRRWKKMSGCMVKDI